MNKSIFVLLKEYLNNPNQSIIYYFQNQNISLKTSKKKLNLFKKYNDSYIPKILLENLTLVKYSIVKEYKLEDNFITKYKVLNSENELLKTDYLDSFAYGLINNIYYSNIINIDIDKLPKIVNTSKFRIDISDKKIIKDDVEILLILIKHFIDTYPIKELYIMTSSINKPLKNMYVIKYHIHLVLDDYYDISNVFIDDYLYHNKIICDGYSKMSLIRGFSNIRISKKYNDKTTENKTTNILPLLSYKDNEIIIYNEGDL